VSLVTFIRGYEVECEEGRDYTKEDERSCVFCGRPPLQCASELGSGADACLGILPKVKAACCGHGDPECAYIIFENGTELRGKQVWEWKNTS